MGGKMEDLDILLWKKWEFENFVVSLCQIFNQASHPKLLRTIDAQFTHNSRTISAQ
jgi:hypothetical protein